MQELRLVAEVKDGYNTLKMEMVYTTGLSMRMGTASATVGILECIDVATVMEECNAAGKLELGEGEGNEKASY